MSEAVPERVGTAEAAVPPFDPERIVAELDGAHRCLPEAAMREAREHRDVMVPRLIQAIRDATAAVRAGDKVDGNAHFLALFMLAEFEAREALPAILEAISLPGEGPFDLFEDAITTVLAGILMRLSDDPLALIDGLIRNGDLNEYVRWEGAQAYLHLVQNGRLSREQAVEHLRQHLRREMDGKDGSPIVSGLVCTLGELAPIEAREEIKEAFSRGMADDFLVDMKTIDREIAEGEGGVLERLAMLEVFDDAIKELRRWAAFQPAPMAKPVLKPVSRPIPQSVSRAARTDSVLPPEPPAGLPALQPGDGKRVGRNAPCPCGSGKKYKKCCLDKDRSR